MDQSELYLIFGKCCHTIKTQTQTRSSYCLPFLIAIIIVIAVVVTNAEVFNKIKFCTFVLSAFLATFVAYSDNYKYSYIFTYKYIHKTIQIYQLAAA